MNATTLQVHQRVRAYLSSTGYCAGWVEVIEPNRIGVRLVNGNFRWCDAAYVRADPVINDGDAFGDGRP